MIRAIYNKETKSIILNINAEIGESEDPTKKGITLEGIMDKIQVENPENIILNIASYGGDAFEGLSIYDYLKATGKKITANIIGSTASSGTIIAMAAENIDIAPNARFLIHRSSGQAVGNADDMRNTAESMEAFDNTIINIYVEKTGKDPEFIRDLMAKNQWLSSKQAVEYGFCNSILKKITNLKINNMDEEQVKALQAENEQLKAKVAELEGKLSEMTASAEKQEDEMVKAEVEAAVEAGKITDVEKDVYMNFGKGNLQGLRDKLKAIEPKQKVFNFKPEPPINMTWSQLHKQNPKLLAELKVNNRKTFAKMYFDEFGTEYKF